MISFADFHPREGPPIYQQIILHIKRGAAAGTVVHGDELPSRRTLSALLGVNPNTVQKAYRLLEEEGLIQSHAGAKSCMVLSPGRDLHDRVLPVAITGVEGTALMGRLITPEEASS